MDTILTTKKKAGMSAKLRRRNIFLVVMLVFPLTQFCIFYIGVNFNSILLAFKTYEVLTDTYNFFTVANFTKFFGDVLSSEVLKTCFRNSGIIILTNVVVVLPLNIYVAYNIWKKIPGHRVWTVILFLPSMLSSIVFVIIAKYGIEYIIPVLIGKPDMSSLLFSADTSFVTVYVYGIWFAFASGMVLYLGSMSMIDPSIIEYGKLEGVKKFRELTQVVVPLIWPTIITFLLVSVMGFFSSYGHFYSFFGNAADYSSYTIGYYFFIMIARNNAYMQYPYAAAAGIVFTLIATPIALGIRYTAKRFGPRVD